MKQIYTFLFSILAFATFASAQIAQDTTYYTDEQGRTVVMIKQNQGTAPAAQQQNGAIQTSPEAALAAGPDEAVYQKNLESYKSSAHKLRVAGNVLLWGGIGLAVVGVALELSDAPDVCDDDYYSDDDCDDSYSGTYITGIILTAVGVDMIPPGIIRKIAARSVDRSGAWYMCQQFMYKTPAPAPANNGYSLLVLPKLDIEHRAAGASLALGF